jgi:hypothetical protein
MMEKEILQVLKVHNMRDPTVEFAVLETARGGILLWTWFQYL